MKAPLDRAIDAESLRREQEERRAMLARRQEQLRQDEINCRVSRPMEPFKGFKGTGQ